MLDAVAIGHCRLRPLQAQDAAPLAAVLARLEPWAGLGYTAAGLERYLSRDDGALQRWVLADADRLAGVLCLRQPWLRGPFLELLCLMPDYQAQGLGGALLAQLVECAGAAGHANLWVSASCGNASALRFYRRHGFAEAGVLPDLIRPGVDEILLRRRL